MTAIWHLRCMRGSVCPCETYSNWRAAARDELHMALHRWWLAFDFRRPCAVPLLASLARCQSILRKLVDFIILSLHSTFAQQSPWGMFIQFYTYSELQWWLVKVEMVGGVLLFGRGRGSCPWQAKAAKAQTQTQQVRISNDLDCICSSGLSLFSNTVKVQSESKVNLSMVHTISLFTRGQDHWERSPNLGKVCNLRPRGRERPLEAERPLPFGSAFSETPQFKAFASSRGDARGKTDIIQHIYIYIYIYIYTYWEITANLENLKILETY